MKASAKQSQGLYESKKHKPRFREGFSLEAMYPWAQRLTTRQKWHFQGIKMSNMSHR